MRWIKRTQEKFYTMSLPNFTPSLNLRVRAYSNEKLLTQTNYGVPNDLKINILGKTKKEKEESFEDLVKLL